MLIVDTAGRLHIDEALMAELTKIKKAVRPTDVLLVVDAMTGQDAVNVAEQFAEAAQFDGVILSKLDGDARGGAALSVKAVTGKPILFASTGEKLENFERFHPDRMAQRILGMGDVLSFIEKAEKQVDEDDGAGPRAQAAPQRVHARGLPRPAQEDPQDGPADLAPGDDARRRRPPAPKMKVDERELDRVEAIILSMTPGGAAAPRVDQGLARLRIAKGSGTTVQQVNQLVKQFGEMRKLMKGSPRGKMPDLGALMRQRDDRQPADHQHRAERLPRSNGLPSASTPAFPPGSRLRAPAMVVPRRVERERVSEPTLIKRPSAMRLLDPRREVTGSDVGESEHERVQPGRPSPGGHRDRVAALA